MSTFQKLLLGGVVVAVVSGGAAWAAVEASNSERPRLSVPVAGGPRLPGRFAPGGGSGPGFGPAPGAGRLGRPGPLEGGRFLCALAHADLVLVEGGTGHQVRLDRGTISSVSSGSVTITEADGSTVAIAVDQDTKIRRGGREASLSELGQGDSVLAVREGSGPARSLRAFDAPLQPCGRGIAGSSQLVPSQPLPSPSPSSA